MWTSLSGRSPGTYVHCVDRIDQFDGLKEDWDAVYAADRHATVFVSWAWLRGWFEVMPYDWCVLVARRRDNSSSPVAFFPLRVDIPGYRLQMAGNPCADYTGFVCLPEYQEDAIKSLAAFVQRRLPWDAFYMRDVFDPRLDYLLDCFHHGSFSVREREGISCPYIPLPDTWEQYLENFLGPRTRKNVRRCMRRIQEDGELRITEVQEDNLHDQIDTFLELYQRRWGPQPEHTLNRFRAVFQRCFENNYLWLNVMWAHNTPISADASFVDRQKMVVYAYTGGWDDRFADLSPGVMLTMYGIQRAIENGFQVYDFMRGSESYKFSFGSEERFNRNVIIVRKSLRLVAKKLVRHLKAICGSKLRRGCD